MSAQGWRSRDAERIVNRVDMLLAVLEFDVMAPSVEAVALERDGRVAGLAKQRLQPPGNRGVGGVEVGAGAGVAGPCGPALEHRSGSPWVEKLGQGDPVGIA